MSFEIKMILIYTVIFTIIGLIVWLIITVKNKKDKAAINREYDFGDNNDDAEDVTLADYENLDSYIKIPERSNDSAVFDSIDDFLNNFSFREEDYDDYYDDDYDVEDNYEMISTNTMDNTKEVVNVLIGKKAYIFLANGHHLDNGAKVVIKIDNKNYNGTIVRSNYERDLSSLTAEPKPLDIVKVLSE